VSDRLRQLGAVADSARALHHQAPISASDRSLGSLAHELRDQAERQLPREDRRLAILQLVGKSGLMLADHLADRLFRKEAEELIHARPRTDAALHRLILEGYLESRDVAYQLTDASKPADAGRAIAGVGFDQALTLTRKASLEFNLPLPPTLRESFITHHVRTMEAIWNVERDFRARGYDVVSWKTETELMREQFHGQVFKRGTVVPMLPDAQLVVRSPDGAEETINIEYVSRSYTDKMIREKHGAFGALRTIWALPASQERLAERVAAITGEEPLTL
jgi:hypothetical protein